MSIIISGSNGLSSNGSLWAVTPSASGVTLRGAVTTDPSAASRYTRQITRYYDSTSRTFSTTFADGPTWNFTGIRQTSNLRFDLNIPHRNDSAGWGGMYMAFWWSTNGGATWVSLGTTGHENMQDSGGDIFHYSNQFYLPSTEIASPSDNYTFTVKLRFRAFDGTLGINNGINHDVNSGGDSNQNANSTHFWTNIIMTEYAAF